MPIHGPKMGVLTSKMDSTTDATPKMQTLAQKHVIYRYNPSMDAGWTRCKERSKEKKVD